MANPDPTSQFAFKSHETALCLIPPRHLWSSVDQLRSLYDKAFGAWPPHINLIYPFVRPGALPEVANLLQDLSIEHQPRITLEGADSFNHKHHNTIFFRPSQDSTADITQLRRHVCNALGQPRTNHGSFTPHMTIGQSEDSDAAPHHFLVEKVRLLPQLAWGVDSIAILVRDAAASGSNGPRPMRLWGTLDLSSRLLTQPTSPRDFRDSSDSSSDIIFQPPYHSPQESGPWAVLTPPAPIAKEGERVLDRLVIASYNVLAEFEWPPQSVRHSGLVDNLLSARSAADILVLQEVTDHFLPVLLADQEIRRRYPYATHGPPGEFGIGPLPSLLNVVVLSRFPLEWHHLPFQRRHKGCTVVRFPTIGIRDRDACFRPWILAACHLSQGLTDGAITAKKREVQRMVDHLSAHFPQHPWILAGDFNLATSSFTIDAARKKQDISSQTVDHLQSIDHMLLDAGFTDTWLATRLESGESSDVVNDKRNVLDSFQGEQGATFDPLTNTLASELVGSGLNNRPQRYDRILVKVDDQYHPLGFNMFGQAPLQPTEQGGPTYASDHWGVRCLLLHSPSAEVSRSSMPATIVQLQRAPANLADNEVLEHFLESQGFLLTAHERVARKEALKALEHALLDATSSVSQGDSRSGPVLILVPVGSYGLGVWTSSSDIDCLCIGSISPKTFFALAVQRLRRAATGGIRILRRVKANSGYMLELEVHGIKMDLQYCAAISIAERWPEVMKRPPNDPAFALPFQTLAKLKPVRDLFYLLRSIPDMVQYRIAHLFIKAWAQSRGIYSAKFGFLGGIHISVLLAPLCKMLAYDGATVSTADIIVTFFQHYARFDWKTALVFDPFFHKDLRYNRTFREPLCLLGWHAPALNTAVNASVPTVDAIATEFERAERLLSAEGFSWNNLLGVEPDSPSSPLSGPGATEFLQNYKSYIKIDAHYWGPSQEKSSRFIGWLESRCVMLLVDLDRKVKNIHARIWPARFLDIASDAESPNTEYHGYYLIGLARNGEESNKDDAKATQVALQAALQEFEARIRRDEKYYDAQSCWMSAAVVRAQELGNLELDQNRWGEFAGDTDDEDEDDDMEEEEESDSDGESQPTAKKNVASSHGSRAAVVSKTPGLGKFRTAADVLNRLRWDAGFDANDFIVGYEDRFLGPRERAVEQWKSEQTDEEFIPQHRILYFKRKSDGVVVWERRSRIDDIFGSGIKTDG
ncbi:hypothetical protein CDV36_006566 [Fusarium kuroshium]|uniref:polynucleotide adenylyltransferase n=1 Tax=Fusarium kuroshium TaxID=2010991 RepID=A0A3M2S952_9HYPO|nr:hypothetical protein CDV36_006566 [Fusarium kuroshium]